MTVEKFRLGGVTPIPWLSSTKLATLISLGAIAMVLMVMIVVTKSLILVVALAAVGGVCVLVWSRRTSDGRPWLSKFGNHIRSWIGRRARWDDFDPAREDQPFLLMHSTRMVSVPAGDGTELGVLEHPNHMVVVLEVSTTTPGVASDDHLNRWQNAVVNLHRELADPKNALVQIDWLTLVRPEDPTQVRTAVPDLALGLSDDVVLSMADLPFEAAKDAERYYSYAVLCFDIDLLFERVAKPPLTESSGPEAAYDAAILVAKILTSKGIEVKAALSLQEIAALLRAVVDPAQNPHDVEGCTDQIFASCPAWRRDTTMVTVPSGEQTWWHTSASFGLDDWPLHLVTGRWLEPIVFGSQLGYRTIITQARLVPRHAAKKFARDQLTTAHSKARHIDNQGKIDGGEAWSKEHLASDITADIVQHGQIGVLPSVRVMLSGLSRREVNNLFDELQTAVAECGAEGITPDHDRPGAALLRLLPIGMEVPQR